MIKGKFIQSLLLFLLCVSSGEAKEIVTIAAASDLQFAMKDLVSLYQKQHPDTYIKVSFGSSGNFFAQIKAGAPYDLFFSADRKYPLQLQKERLVAGIIKPYGFGRIVLWCRNDSGIDLSKGMQVLLDARVKRIAIANPAHAPYGERAKESLMNHNLWEKVQERLVLGENISQAAQFAQTGNAQVGIVSLSLAVSPAMMKDGKYLPIDQMSHQPLEQVYAVLKPAASKKGALGFAAFIDSREARDILQKYGFTLVGK